MPKYYTNRIGQKEARVMLRDESTNSRSKNPPAPGKAGTGFFEIGNRLFRIKVTHAYKDGAFGWAEITEKSDKGRRSGGFGGGNGRSSGGF